MARESSVVIVLLHDQLRPGTCEELLAVKGDADVNLKVLWFPSARRWWHRRGASEVETFLGEHKNEIYYKRSDEVDGEDAWVVLIQNLVATLLKALRSGERTPYVEAR